MIFPARNHHLVWGFSMDMLNNQMVIQIEKATSFVCEISGGFLLWICSSCCTCYRSCCPFSEISLDPQAALKMELQVNCLCKQGVRMIAKIQRYRNPLCFNMILYAYSMIFYASMSSIISIFFFLKMKVMIFHGFPGACC